MLMPMLTLECATHHKYSQIFHNSLEREVGSGRGGEFKGEYG